MKKTLDLSLYLVLDPVLCGGIDGMAETARIAVAEGANLVQLRADGFKKRDWFLAAEKIKKALLGSDATFIINNEIDVALAVDADGVHIGQNDLPVAVVRRLIGSEKILGLSLSNEAELKAVPLDIVDYLGIGPVFPTTSKTNPPPALGLEKLAHLVALKKKQAVGIGGITADLAADVLKTGVEGIAVVSAICGQADVREATIRLRRAIKEA